MKESLKELKDLIKQEVEAALEEIGSATEGSQLEEVERNRLGKRSLLARLRKELKELADPGLRRDLGQQLNEAQRTISTFLSQTKERLSASAPKEGAIDLTEGMAALDEDPSGRVGVLHAVSRTQMELEDVFIAMGFEVVEGPEIETDHNNFEALNIPADHPARGMWDTLYIEESEGLLLRTHTSPVQIRVMSTRRPPIYVVAPGRCYRRDTPDARHLPVFHQIEGLVVDEAISFADLAGTIEEFTRAYFGRATRVRFRPSYFPFTEPSAEFEISCVICAGKGCRTCSQKGWIELGGAGMVHYRVLKGCGIDPDAYSGFAFGFGIERLAQMRYGLEDIRMLAEPDLRILRRLRP